MGGCTLPTTCASTRAASGRRRRRTMFALARAAILGAALSAMLAPPSTHAQNVEVEATTLRVVEAADAAPASRSDDLLAAWRDLDQGDLETARVGFATAVASQEDRLEALIGLGQTLSRLGEHPEALEQLNAAAAAAPDDPEARFQRGLAHLRAGAPGNAVPDLEFAAQKRAENWIEQLRLGDARYALRDWRGALAAYQRAAELAPRPSAVIWRSLGNANYASGAFSDAQEAYGRALEINPEDAVARLYRAWASKRLGELATALEDYDAIVELAAPNPAFLIARGDLRYRLQDLEGAHADLSRAFAMDRRFGRLLLARTRALLSAGRTEQALATIDVVLDGAAGDRQLQASALFLRGRARLQRRDAVGAEKDYELLLQIRPRDGDAHINRALARISLGDLNGAFDDLLIAVQLRSEDAAALYAFGRTAIALGRRSEAIAAFERAEALRLARPDDISTRMGRGQALMGLGAFGAAVSEFDHVLGLSPDNPEALRRKTQALLRLPEPQAAVASAERLIETRPQDPVNQILYAEALTATGQTAAARDTLRRSAEFGGDRAAIARATGEAWLVEARRGDDMAALEQAERAFDAELAISPNNVDALNRRAAVRMRLGRYSLAMRDLDQAIGLAPSDARLRLARAENLQALGRCAEAIRDYDAGLAVLPNDGPAQRARAACKLNEGRVFGAIGDFAGSLF